MGTPVQTLEDAAEPFKIWQLGDVIENSQGERIQRQLLGDRLVQTQTYGLNGHIKSIAAGIYSGHASIQPSVMHQSYQFDTIGNLLAKTDYNIGLKPLREWFTYDALNRLKNRKTFEQNSDGSYGDYSLASGGQSVDYKYDLLGNLIYRSDKGVLTGSSPQNLFYSEVDSANNSVSPYAITSAYGVGSQASSSIHYQYDNYGNVTKRGNKNIEYNVFNKPTNIDGAYFAYTATHKRYRKTSNNGAITYYADSGAFEETMDGPIFTQTSYIDGVFIKKSISDYSMGASSVERRFTLKDHLGSINVITNEIGQIAEQMSFNAWGERRNPDMSSGPASSAGTTTRGYTGHEMLDDHGLIHMNGRVYDPNIGRFLSADIVVQSPSNSQSYNRYSYVLNNSLSLIDPSGYTYEGCPPSDATGCGQMVDDLGGPATMPCEQGGDMETCEVTGYVPPGACGADVDCQMNEYLQAIDKMHDEFIEQAQPTGDMFGGSTERTLESPQERINRLNRNVSKNYPSLASPQVIAVKDAGKYSGKFTSNGKVIVEYGGSDSAVESSIFHERLHVDEANYTTGGSQGLYILHEFIEHGIFHDPNIDKMTTDYYRHIQFPNVNGLPQLNDLPWRKE